MAAVTIDVVFSRDDERDCGFGWYAVVYASPGCDELYTTELYRTRYEAESEAEHYAKCSGFRVVACAVID